jgi:ribonuclease HIII
VTFTGRIIGVDESGKGDFFGPLVVAGFVAGDDDLAGLTALGVKDSKKIADKKLLQIDEALRSRYAYVVTVIMPEDYNRRYSQLKNLNLLLAEGHAATIQGVLQQSSADMAISDKFGKDERLETALDAIACTVPIRQIVGGESILQVAAASILARAEFLRRLRGLSEEYGIELPKGAASHVDEAGRRLVAKYGPEILSSVAKTHFRNQQRALAGNLFA